MNLFSRGSCLSNSIFLSSFFTLALDIRLGINLHSRNMTLVEMNDKGKLCDIDNVLFKDVKWMNRFYFISSFAYLQTW